MTTPSSAAVLDSPSVLGAVRAAAQSKPALPRLVLAPSFATEWLALIIGLTVVGAYLPLGAFNTGLAMAIALGKALIVAAIFMELRERNALTIVFAGAGFFWLGIMLVLALSDYMTRGWR